VFSQNATYYVLNMHGCSRCKPMWTCLATIACLFRLLFRSFQGSGKSSSWREKFPQFWRAGPNSDVLSVIFDFRVSLGWKERVGCSSEGSSEPEHDSADAPPQMEVGIATLQVKLRTAKKTTQ
jgi:hypothetical protein